MTHFSSRASRRALLLAAVGVMALAACRQAPAAPAAEAPAVAAPTEAPAEAPAAAMPSGEKPVIKLAENPWTGSSVNVYVAKQLLEEKLGYTVEVVTIDENAQWPALAKGDLSASLEVWPSGHAKNVVEYVDNLEQVENLGTLGVVGRIGWYVPTYVIKEHPELATYEGFQKPELAALFKTAETGDKGQFLQGDPSWVYYDADIIKNLNMNMQVVQAGSENALFAAVDSAYSRQQPIVFYYWSPNWPFAKYDFTKVELPPNTADCYAKADTGGVACDYPEDALFKIASAKLKDEAPEAYQFLKSMSYTNDDQVSMIGTVVLDKKTAEDAAKAWVEKNEAVWSQWLPK